MSKPYDLQKDEENKAKHGVSFADVTKFEWDTAITNPDTRFEYGEPRFISYGFIGDRLHALIWTSRNEAVRPISFRKANERERKKYDQEIRSGCTLN